MNKPTIAPYGSWKSPLTSDLIVSEAIRLGQLTLDGDDLYWVESRPKEGGRNIVIRMAANGHIEPFTPNPFNVRTRVHEYGGGAYLASRGTIYFSNFSDQRLYTQFLESIPRPITSEGCYRYADGTLDRGRNRIICVREDHSDSSHEPENTLVSLSLYANIEENDGQILQSGSDFYSSPRLSPNGRYLAWISWDHPNMPWDDTKLWIADVQENGSLGEPLCVAGGRNESIFQPEWSPDGVLFFVSDRTGWWNLYRFVENRIDALCPMEAEFGEPQWNFGLSTYAFESSRHLICTYTQQGTWHLSRLDTDSQRLEAIPLPFSEIGGVKCGNGRAYCIASSPTIPTCIIQIDLDSHEVKTLRSSVDFTVDPQYLSLPEPIEYPTGNGKTAHAFFYKPRNDDFAAPTGERPPLMVKSHGGPTGSTSSACNLLIQYWTSRGFAVVDVNYGGSTGYGRSYRERLRGQWGIVDVDDCVNSVQFLINQGAVDPKRIAITGGSAGGYTTLCALTFREIFTAGSSYYGVSDLEALVHDTHKFESRYLDKLVGPLPESQERYRERSPIHFTHQLCCPIILFQGLEDKVVLPNQAEMMFEVVKKKGLPVAYVAFEDEQHGFRKAENIKRVLDSELFFYSKIFGFEPATLVEPIEIQNLLH